MREPNNNPPAPGNPAPPASPGIVKKTQNTRPPKEVELEKKISVLEDKVTGFESWQAEVNRSLEGIVPAPAPPPRGDYNPPSPPAPAPAGERSILDEII